MGSGISSLEVDSTTTCVCVDFFFFQAEDGIRDLVRSRGLGDVYKRQIFSAAALSKRVSAISASARRTCSDFVNCSRMGCSCLLYTSDAADDLLCVDLGGRRIIKKQKPHTPRTHRRPPLYCTPLTHPHNEYPRATPPHLHIP